MAVEETTAPPPRPLAARLRLVALADPVVRLLAAAFVAGQILDAITTELALGSGHFAEANPFFAGPLSAHPVIALAAKLLLGLCVLGGALRFIGASRRRVVLAVLTLISLQAPLMNALRMAGVL